MADIFVSYASEDRERIVPLVRTLEAEGWTVWWDRNLVAGPDFDFKIEQALDAAKCVVVAWSKHAVQSRWCRAEAGDGLDRQILVPVRLDNTRPPLAFRNAHTASLIDWPEEGAELALFLAGVRSCLGEPEESATTNAGLRSAQHVDSDAAVRATNWLVAGVASVAIAALVGVGSYSYWTRDGAPSAGASGVPRVAVLPFDNRSAEPDDRYFGDGLAEDIATALSRFQTLVVIPPNVTTKYRDIDVTSIVGELNVRYVVRGSVTRRPDRVRVSAQLIDPQNDSQLWAETYNRDFQSSDLLDVRSDIATQIASTLADATGIVVTIGLQEVRQRNTESMAAYDCVLRGHAYVAVHTDETHKLARDCLEQAVQIDPTYADAWAHLAYLYQEEYHHNRNLEPHSLNRALDAAQRALELDATNAMGLMALAMTRFSQGEIELSLSQLRRALALNPNDNHASCCTRRKHSVRRQS